MEYRSGSHMFVYRYCIGMGTVGCCAKYNRWVKKLSIGRGFTSLLSVMVGMMAMVYGFAIDMYRTDRDLVRGLSYGFVYFRAILLHCFRSAVFASLHYTGLDALLGISPVAFRICYTVCALGMLFFGE